MEVSDRIASLEQRVQMQEDDIQLLKSALADVVRRLNITEEQQAVLNRKGPTKGGHCTGTRAARVSLKIADRTKTQNHSKQLALSKQSHEVWWYFWHNVGELHCLGCGFVGGH